MKKIIFITGILFYFIMQTIYSATEEEKNQAWINDDPKYVEYLTDIEKRN